NRSRLATKCGLRDLSSILVYERKGFAKRSARIDTLVPLKGHKADGGGHDDENANEYEAHHFRVQSLI
ncbi:MAG: hypothetical protein KDJ43_07635, partial [Rhizobiaceae bacterium]|nr:hypothetical protein [Rhizobiaceae bacterium]